MPEGNGTVLDNSCLMWLSNMWIGRKHDNTRLPLVLAGGLGGTLQTGRTMDYREAGDENRKMSSLFLSLMDRMGVKLEGFGQASRKFWKPTESNMSDPPQRDVNIGWTGEGMLP